MEQLVLVVKLFRLLHGEGTIIPTTTIHVSSLHRVVLMVVAFAPFVLECTGECVAMDTVVRVSLRRGTRL